MVWTILTAGKIGRREILGTKIGPKSPAMRIIFGQMF